MNENNRLEDEISTGKGFFRAITSKWLLIEEKETAGCLMATAGSQNQFIIKAKRDTAEPYGQTQFCVPHISAFNARTSGTKSPSMSHLAAANSDAEHIPDLERHGESPHPTQRTQCFPATPAQHCPANKPCKPTSCVCSAVPSSPRMSSQMSPVLREQSCTKNINCLM